MNKKILTHLTMLMTVMSFSAQSALVLTGTRFIYNSEVKAIPVKVTNRAETPYGAQFWIENADGSDLIPFSVSPSIFSLKADDGEQTVQISKLDEVNQLKDDRETLFTVNLQEIPPKSKDELSGNVLMLASRTVVKLMYRPDSIKEGRQIAEQNVTVSKQGKTLTFNNPTPYYFAIISVNEDKNAATPDFNRMAPFSQASTTLSSATGNKVTFEAIDDYGAVRTYSCDLTKTLKQCEYVKEAE